ncbi:MAG: response regulator [Desulfobacteraceae bacterium]
MTPINLCLLTLSGAVLCSGILFFVQMKKKKKSSFFIHLILILLTLAVAVISFFSGGIESPALVWLFPILWCAGTLIDLRSILWYCLSGALVVIILLCLTLLEIPMPSLIAETWAPFYFSFNFLALFPAAAAFFYISLKKQAEREKTVRREKEKAENADQTKSAFLADLSHEIRTPMNGIMGILHLLMERPLPGVEKKYLEIILNNANAILTIINDILDFSKIEAGRLDLDIIDFDLDVTFNEITAMPAALAEQKGIDFVHAIDPKIPRKLCGDPGRIRQIISNLISNALKFTDDGEISLRVTLESETENKVRLKFIVEDTGMGIDPDAADNLFSPFVQADPSIVRNYGGTGLGLSICRRLAEKMNGTIGVDSIEFVGSTFWFTAELKKNPKAPVQRNETSLKTKKFRVLVTSDKPCVCIKTDEQIKAMNIETMRMENSASIIPALETACLANHPFDAVLLNIHETDAFAEKLGMDIKKNTKTSDVQLILFSCTGKKGDARRFEKAGFDAFLSKPVDKLLLENCFKALADKKSNPAAYPNIITRHSLAEHKKYTTRILLVEDRETNRVVAESLLYNLGFQADTAENGQKAVEMVKAGNYDIVLMDTQMPVMDGFEATQQIRQWEKKTQCVPAKIIALTAKVLQQDKDACIEAGMDDFLTKPLNPEKFAKIINKNSLSQSVLENRSKAQPATRAEKENHSHKAPSGRHKSVVVYDEKKMLERFDHNQDLIQTVVDSFNQEAPELVDRLIKATDKTDDMLIRDICHALKGCAANAGALDILETAREMEKLIKSDNMIKVKNKAVTLKDKIESYIKETAR